MAMFNFCWFTHEKNGTFPVRYLDLYQKLPNYLGMSENGVYPQW
jgi:hypothetical protein